MADGKAPGLLLRQAQVRLRELSLGRRHRAWGLSLSRLGPVARGGGYLAIAHGPIACGIG